MYVLEAGVPIVLYGIQRNHRQVNEYKYPGGFAASTAIYVKISCVDYCI